MFTTVAESERLLIEDLNITKKSELYAIFYMLNILFGEYHRNQNRSQLIYCFIDKTIDLRLCIWSGTKRLMKWYQVQISQ